MYTASKDDKNKGDILMNKLKKVTALIMATATVFFGFSTTTMAKVVSEGTSKAEIKFNTGGGLQPPVIVDPTDPEEIFPTDPDDRDDGDPVDPPTGETGPLTLDFVSSVVFGEHDIDSETTTYHSKTLRPFIQVTDRRGTAEGWSVTAKASRFTVENEAGDVESTLPGAVLTFSNGSVISTSKSDKPTPAEEVGLSAGGDSAKVVHADVNTGMGKWINRWFPSEDADEGFNDNVTLEVPAGAATTGEHIATISWTLSDAPGQ